MSTFYSLNPEVDAPLINGFFNSVSGNLPSVVDITVEPTGDVLNETTGELTGTWTTDALTGVEGTIVGGYAGPVGMCVIWETGVVMDQSRLRGKTYLVPLAGLCFDLDGTPADSVLATIRGAAASLAADSQLVVWHRPRAARAADGSRPAVTARAGGYANITSSTVHDIAAVLTSRRD